jgi:hypothetical protein
MGAKQPGTAPDDTGMGAKARKRGQMAKKSLKMTKNRVLSV